MTALEMLTCGTVWTIVCVVQTFHVLGYMASPPSFTQIVFLIVLFPLWPPLIMEKSDG